MKLDALVREFLAFTQDAVAIGYRAAGEDSARLVYVNDACVSVFGMSREAMLGQKVNILHDPDGWEAYTRKIAAKLRDDNARFRAEVNCRRADGSIFAADISLFLVPASDQAGGRYSVGVFRDITELRQREERAARALAERDKALAEQKRLLVDLHTSEARLVSVINTYPMPFVVYDKDLRLVLCNDAYRTAMSTDPESVRLGMSMDEIIAEALRSGRVAEPSEGRPKFTEKIIASVRNGEPVQDIEIGEDIHHRLFRSTAENGDLMILRVDISDFKRQSREADQAQRRLISALNAYPDPFSIYDQNAFLVTCNTAYRRRISPSDPEAVKPGMHMREVLALEKAAEGDTCDPAVLDAKIARTFEEARIGGMSEVVQKDGAHFHVIRSISDNGDLVSLKLDITEQERQRHEAEAARNRLMASINAFPDPIAIFDAENRLAVWNPAYAASLNCSEGEVRAGRTARDLLLMAARGGRILAAKGREEAWVDSYLAGGNRKTHWDVQEFSDDTHYRVLVSKSDNAETLVLRLDVSETVRQGRDLKNYAVQLEAANKEITQKALHDELTGLGNRRFLSEKFEEFRMRRNRCGGELVALHVDLDRFKQINDTIGHAAGDHVLTEVAKRIRKHVRGEDVVARIGGDEFVILLHLEMVSDRATQLAQALIDEMAVPVFFEGRECRFGASVGIAFTPLADLDGLLAFSDIALYKAKRAGRGRYALFDTQDIEDMRQTKAMADDIMRAIENAEFAPYYQPQVDPVTGQMLGVEALARWHHPQKGVLTPDIFLPVAEDLNVVADIDRMIFEKAMVECQKIFAEIRPWPSLSFNVSSRRIKDGAFDKIALAVAAYPGEVAFELLETIFMEEEDDGFLMQIDRLRDMGIGIEVDDFGSGRASIVALQKIAPDRLKIDGRLVMPIAEGNNASRLVQSIIEIGHVLGIGVTAEGVETAEQVRILAELGADRLQGFHFAKPLCGEDLAAYLRKNNDTIAAQ